MSTLIEKNQNIDVNILWTGGFDSTYRIIELSRMLCTVQPVYIFGDNRKSEKYEINSMNKILLDLSKKESTKATFLPIKFIDKRLIPLNQDITKAYELISNETGLGSQHEWLARLAIVNPGLELGTELAPLEISNILTTIDKYGKLIVDKNTGVFSLDPEKSSKEVLLLLGYFNFPIINKTGEIMKKDIYSWGYEDVIKNVWVCHRPLYGKPCGLCHPCELKIETHMEFLLTQSALHRYNKSNTFFSRVLYKINRKINNIIEIIKPDFFIMK